MRTEIAGPQAHAVIERVMRYPIDEVIEKYIKKSDIPIEVAREHERELKRFLALCIINPGAHYGMNGVVDDLWHTFILFTREYAEFCQKVAGFFIHHAPVTVDEIKSTSSEVPNTYVAMLRDYAILYGEKPPADVWPRHRNSSLQNEGVYCGESSCSRGGDDSVACGPAREGPIHQSSLQSRFEGSVE